MLLFIGIACNISSLTWRTFGFIIYALTGLDYTIIPYYIPVYALYFWMFCNRLDYYDRIWMEHKLHERKGFRFIHAYKYIYPYLVLMMGALNVITTLLTKMSSGRLDSHHMFDSVPGVLLISYRALLLVPFIIGIVMTYQSSRHRVKSFIVKFAIFGACYIAALPLIWLYARSNVR